QDGRFLTRAVLSVGRRGEAPEPTGLPPRTECHVLVAEDNEVNARIARRMLERLGCTVEVAKDGREAVEKTGTADYDVVFMDVRMPYVDGYEATARIRERDETRRRVPVVAMTAD